MQSNYILMLSMNTEVLVAMLLSKVVVTEKAI